MTVPAATFMVSPFDLISSPRLWPQPPYVAPECFDTNNKSLTAKAVSSSRDRLTAL